MAWIAGEPFNLLLTILQRYKARLTWRTTFRDLTLEHVVDICEGGLAYDASLFVGAVIELAQYIAPDAATGFTEKLQLLQKMLKYSHAQDARCHRGRQFQYVEGP